MLTFIREELVEHKNWLDDKEFLEMLGITQSLPGPLAVSFAILAGYHFQKLRGALFSLLGAVLPSFLIILIIAAYFWQYADNRAVQAAFRGIRPIVVALITSAAVRLGKDIPREKFTLILFLLFLGILLYFRIHPLVVIGIGALAGAMRAFYYKYGKRGAVK